MAVTAASAPEDPSLGKLRQQAQKIFDTDFPDRADFTIFYPDEELKNRRDQFPEDWWRLYCHAEVRKRYDPSNPLTSFEFQ